LPWAFDPKTEALITVVPGSEPLDVVVHGPASLARLGRSSHGDVLLIVLGGFFMLIPVVFVGPIALGLAISCLGGPQLATVFGMLITTFMGAVFSYLGYRVVRPPLVRVIGRRRLSVFELTVPDTVSPGETIPVRIQVTPRRDILAEEVRVELRLSEVAVSGSGTKKTTHRHSQTLTSVVMNKAQTLAGRRPVTFSGELTVPQDTGFTFAAAQNSVFFQLVGVVDCPGIFDPETATVVTVVPSNLIRGR
jgi:hypothetical protein